MFFFSPLEQFETVIIDYFIIFPITNFLIYIIIVLFVYIFFFYNILFINARLIPRNWQLIGEMLYNFILDIVKLQIGPKGQVYFPFIFVIFMFILVSNLVGFTLFGYTITSHISLTFGLSLSYFIFCLILGIKVQKWGFLHTFLPGGTPVVLIPLLVCIEIISYTARAFSLGIRLFANLLSGHTLLAIIGSFAFYLTKNFIYLAVIPIFFIIVILFLELAISFLQAYVFAVLASLYLGESLFGSH